MPGENETQDRAFYSTTASSGHDHDHDHSPWVLAFATVCLIWYIFVVGVCALGYVQLRRRYSSVPRPSVSASLPQSDVPHVTVLRPVKGLEPSLYECLAATFRQNYPRDKLTIYLCVSSSADPSLPILRRLIEDFPDFDAKILIEEDDPNLREEAGHGPNLGPNPKIRNMSRGYREAKGDLIWIIDCNVWVARGVMGRMVDRLCGYGHAGRGKKYKFVHQLPLVIDTAGTSSDEEARSLLDPERGEEVRVASTSTASYDIQSLQLQQESSWPALAYGGGRLEEMFMASSHAKFYTAINTVLVAPCIVGKSNMFRRSHLNYVTSSNPSRAPGIDFFSDNICEDHLIGDTLWRKAVPEEEAGERWGKHALVFGDLAIQPMAGMSVKEYIARRVRWLRVRKFTVTLATLVEHGTESFFCSFYGAFALTTLPWFNRHFGIPQTWVALAIFWLLSVSWWALVDWTLYLKLHSGESIESDEFTPAFATTSQWRTRRPIKEWLCAWLGREALAFPIWVWAVFGGVTVVWRGRKFWVGMDMKVHEVDGPGLLQESSHAPAQAHAHATTHPHIHGHGHGHDHGSNGAAQAERRKARSD
ncbi:MAG: hypothetical protein M1819_005724 [Sarea resinae]|nr:MAG: hypothetical protein M1819_005724 [Sarea resinae]